MVRTIRRSYFGLFAVIATMVLLCVMATSSGAAAGDTTRVSVASDGTEGNNRAGGPFISADGRYVVFSSHASNLVPGDTNLAQDIFVRDRDADNDGVMDEPEATKTERVNVDSSGNEANGFSAVGSISANGRFVAFTSWATNLVPGDTNVDPNGNPASDIFVHDRQTGTTERVSVNSSETEANSYSHFSSISADGRYVTFQSNANNLAAGDPWLDADIYVRDRQAGTTELVSVGSGNWPEYGSSISADGRYVAFFSGSTTLVAGDTNGRPDVFVRDLVNKTTERIRAECATFSCRFQSTASISADGRYVAFESDASDLVAGDSDTNGRPDVLVHDRQAGTTQRVSVAGCASEANGDSLSPRVSPNGRYVAFQSSATNLVNGDTNGFTDVFVRDLVDKTTQRVSVSGSGTQANGGSVSASINASGVYVAFSSDATNLVGGDTNGFTDVFVHERGNAPQPSSDCVAPTVTAHAPTGGTVSVGASAEVVFSEDMDQNTLTSATFTLTKEGSASPLVGTTVSYDGASKKATLDPATNLEANATYTARIKGGSTGAKDLAGNALAQDYTWTFTTDDTAAPTAKAPTHTFTTLSTLGTTTVPVKLSWSATDNPGGSGIASYQLQQSINGGAYTDVTLPSATTTTISRSLAPGTNTYRFRVAAKDNAGNLSAWASGPSFKVSTFQESSSAIVDTGSWTTSALSGAYGGSVQYASALGRNATFSVPVGTKNVEWVSYRGPNRGKAQVWLDGVQQDANPSVTGIQPFDLYSSTAQARKVVFSKAVSATTSHNLQVRVFGQKNASSTSTRVDIDAFVRTS